MFDNGCLRHYLMLSTDRDMAVIADALLSQGFLLLSLQRVPDLNDTCGYAGNILWAAGLGAHP